MRIKRRDLNILIENMLKEDKTDPGIDQEVDLEKTTHGASYVDQQMQLRGVKSQKKADDAYDRAKAQHDIDFGSERNRRIAFGPRPEGRSEPITDDDMTYADLDFDHTDPSPNQIRHGQEYHQFYKDVDKSFDSVHSDKTQSYIDDDDDDTEEVGDYGALGKTQPAISFDDKTIIDPGKTIFSTNPDDDLDLSLSDIELDDDDTFEDDSEEDSEEEGMIAKIRKFLNI